MNNFFSYDNPIMQILMKIGDLMILNFLYLAACIPLFTVGAASAGLYTAMKVMQDPEDDTSLVEAFIRGFKAGFGTVTLAWGLALLLTFLISYACYLGYYNFNLAAWLCVPPILVCLWATALIPAIHSRFGCTVWQLIRNVWFFMVAHPLRTLGVTILTWLPMVLLVSGFLAQDIFGFMAMAPIWITLYFGTAWAFNYSFLKKPFNVLIDHFNEKNAPAEDENALPEAEPIFRDDN